MHLVMFNHREGFHEGDDENGKYDCGCSIIEMLISYGADINAKDENGATPFHLAAENHCEKTIQMLLKTGEIDVNRTDDKGESPLVYMIDTIGEAKEKREDWDCPDWAILRLENCLNLLENNDCNFNTVGKFGNSPIHYLLDYTEISLSLLEKFTQICRPNMSQRNYLGLTPLHAAVNILDDFSEERAGILKFICAQKGTNVDDVDMNMKSALMYSVINGHVLYCEVLLSIGATINLIDRNGLTALHYASIGCNSTIVSLLLRYGANPNVMDCYGDTPIIYAAMSGMLNNLRLLSSHYEMNDDLCNKLRSAADYHDRKECYDFVGSFHQLKETIDLERREGEKDGIPRIEIKLEEVDSWIEKQRAFNTVKGDNNTIPILQRHHNLQERCLLENQGVCEEVTEFLSRISKIIKEEHPMLSFTPVLSGSASEGTKIGFLDEIDFLCYICYKSI